MRHEGYVRNLIQVRDRGANITNDASMTQFFFDLHECGRVLIDDEGVEMPDADAARTNAVHEARQIMACHIEVHDEARNVVLVVAFADAIVLSGYQPKAIHS
jgi:hypothetical protein